MVGDSDEPAKELHLMAALGVQNIGEQTTVVARTSFDRMT
jgi:hypothetical protein